MATDHLETEQKYEADPGFVMPDLSAIPLSSWAGVATVRGPKVHRLSATYFDTEDLRLAAHGITLRRRTGGTDAGWHLKLPVRAGTRQELQEPLDDAGGAEGTASVPPRFADKVAEITEGRPLAPVAILNTERTVRELMTTDGKVLAEVADDLVTAQRAGLATGQSGSAAGQSGLMTWREIEVEAQSASPDLLDAAGKLLREAGARPSKSGSKLGRLLSTAP